ncbi:MAG: hypothetical protein M5T61_10385 [Acidimicrobiia bacterium]|nr:hypothetical protein [Acidimicrobiia bacterium]
MIPVGGGTAKVDAAAVNEQNGDGSDGSKGDVSYAWVAGNTDTAGLFLGSWVVTFAGGAVQTYPNGGYVLIRITPAVMVLGSNYTTVEAVKKTRQLSGTTYADDDIQIAIGAASRAIDLLTNRHFYRDDPADAPVVRLLHAERGRARPDRRPDPRPGQRGRHRHRLDVHRPDREHPVRLRAPERRR